MASPEPLKGLAATGAAGRQTQETSTSSPPGPEVVDRVEVADIDSALIGRRARVSVLIHIHAEKQHVHPVQLLEKNDAPDREGAEERGGGRGEQKERISVVAGLL